MNKGRVMIAGTHSGCGKTTVICSLLAALKTRGLALSSFKCGPDYIDPMFHRQAIGVAACNLDPYFCTPRQLRQLLATYGRGISLLEGAMGYYDGVGASGCYSAYDVAAATATPVVLVVDARGMYASAGALLQGFAAYRQDSFLRGVIFNRASDSLYEGLRQLALRAGFLPLGFLPPTAPAGFASRHLGLVTAAETENLPQKLALLGELAERHIDLDGLLALAAQAPPIAEQPLQRQPLGRARIAVANDEAFCFRYAENLSLLQALGCELCFFSPLHDRCLPSGCAGLYLCGGYPELHLPALAQNSTMLHAVREAINSGMPTVAECGGFLYLHQKLDGIPLAGVIAAEAWRGDKLRHFGYVELRAQEDNLLCAAGERIRTHEFHYYESSDPGAGFHAQKPLRLQGWDCVHSTKTLYAGFPHLYWEAAPHFAENFVRKVLRYETESAGPILETAGRTAERD